MLIMTTNERKTIPWFLFGCLWYMGFSAGFNVDTKFPLIFSDGSQRNTYFGFSVGLHENRGGSWLLAGAPRANTSHIDTAIEPGAIYKCNIKSDECTEIPFYQAFLHNSSSYARQYSYKELIDGSWLGVSLDVAPTSQSHIIACAHLWKDETYYQMLLVNGMCFVTDEDLLPARGEKLTPLTERGKQIHSTSGNYQYGLGMAGLSVHFLENSNNLIIGAPGVLDFAGALIYSSEKGYTRPRDAQEFRIPEPPEDIDADSYLGYSVSSGYFLSADVIHLVAGAPRDGPTGAVHVLDVPLPEQRAFISRIKKEGTQLGEYFGAVVCGIDINNDGWSELLVGAPFHSINVDEGRVYLYMNMHEGRLGPANVITGSLIPKSLFGSAITAIGDLNQDGFQDVAIGAPFEDSVGAVYIYFGHNHGMHLSQKILASSLHSDLKGFGISISKGKDVDKNYYLDLAIGAHESNRAVILRSYPVVNVKSEIHTNIEKINTNEFPCSLNDIPFICFNVMACVNYTSTNGPRHLSFKNTLTTGSPDVIDSRAYFVVHLNNLHEVVFDLNVENNVRSCEEFAVHISNTAVNFLNPLKFYLKTEIVKSSSFSNTDFCKNCPVRDSKEEDFVIKEVPFKIDCGEDDICNSELLVTGYLLGFTPGMDLVLGTVPSVTLKVKVENQGEPAYGTSASISFPSNTNIERKPYGCEESNEDSHPNIICDLANPLKTNSTAELEVVVDLSNVKAFQASLQFHITCTTTSKNMDSNLTLAVTLPLKSDSFMNIVGQTSEEQILYRTTGNNTIQLFHIFEVFKIGHTPVDSVFIEIGIPHILNGADESFVEIQSMHATTTGDFGSYNDNCRINETTIRAFNVKDFKTENHILICIDAPCHYIHCNLGAFLDQETAILIIHMLVHLNRLKDLIDAHNIVDFVTSGRLYLVDNANDTIFTKDVQVITQFFKGDSSVASLPVWGIILCIGIGILLLSIIVFILAKSGFFRRKIREEMEKLTSCDQLLLDDEVVNHQESASAKAEGQ